MKFNNLELNTEITITESEDGELLFNLHEIARNLKYQRPNRTVNEFVAKHIGDKTRDPRVPEGTLFEEWVLYLFLMESNAAGALPFKKWVAKEVLPTIRKVGMQAIYKLALLEARGRGEIKTVEDMLRIAPKEIVDEALATGDYYRQQGYLAPSDFKIPLAKFYEKLISEKYLTPEGDLIRTDKGVLCTRWSCSRLPNGKWYAWKPEVADLFSTPSIEEPSSISTTVDFVLSL